MELLDLWRECKRVIDSIEFSTIWEGFKPYPFILYNGTEMVEEGKLLPKDENLFGNTAVKRKGEFVAIWNVEMDPITTAEEFSHHLVHEMFHCFQFEMNAADYADELKLKDVPLTADTFILKQAETHLLAHGDIAAFWEVRSLRMSDSFVLEEMKVEMIEGSAEYAGLMGLKQMNLGAFEIEVERLKDDLLSDKYLYDIRRQSYFTGALLYLFEARPKDLAIYVPESSITFKVDQKKNDIEEQVNDMKSEIFHPVSASIVGIDPMNMERTDQYLLSKTFLMLDNGMKFHSPVLAKLSKENDWQVVGLWYKEEEQ